MFKSRRPRTFNIPSLAASALAVACYLAVAPAVTANAAAPPAPPFKECPAIGSSASCEILLVVNADKTVSVEGDPSVGPFDGNDDTLVGIINNSTTRVKAVTVAGPGSGLSKFDGDGICSGDYGSWNGSAGCPYGPTGYEGPGTSFVTSTSLPDSAEVDFAGGLAPGKSTYFSLEGALTSAKLTAREGGLSTFTITGSDKSTEGQAGKQDHGSPKDAESCKTPWGQFQYRADEDEGRDIATIWQKLGLTTASEFLQDFLNGSGAAVNLPDTSLAASEIKKSSAFTTENKNVLAYIKQQLDDGVTQIGLPTPNPLHTFAFTSHSTAFAQHNADDDLYLAFRYTHEVEVNGSGSIVGDNYVGSLTYVIGESYGFNAENTLYGIGTDMRYLQTVCGAPYYPGGAQWFPISVTITKTFSLPRSSS